MTVLWLALAGGLGATLRSLTDVALPTRRFPRATFLVNVTGSLALGLIVGSSLSSDVQRIVGTGLLGGFTTFSSASLTAAQAWLESRRAGALTQAIVMPTACVAAASLGVWIAS